jgi:S-adenosylmethionine-diacylgycerolhomoserine-N-methlytransferase
MTLAHLSGTGHESMSKMRRIAADLKILKSLALGGSRSGSHADKLESFYASQAEYYDEFRKRLLPGRREMVRAIPFKPGDVWVDLGGGTGANLEEIQADIASLKSVYVVDLASSLLNICQRRVQRHGWTNVHAVCADASAFIPAEQLADVVSFSYSLTMMPDWQRVLEHAIKILRPGGVLAMVDFYLSADDPVDGRPHHSLLKRRFLRRWFAHDQVWLGPERLDFATRRSNFFKLHESSAKLPWLPLVKVPWFYLIAFKTE